MAQEEQAAKADLNPKQRHDEDAEEEVQGEKARLAGRLSSADVDLEKGVELGQSPRDDLHRDDGSGHPPSTPEVATPTEAVPTTSVKARGKMKARRSTSLETSSSLDRAAAARVGRNGFVPTDEWVRLVLCSSNRYFINLRCPGRVMATRVIPLIFLVLTHE
jgi:hypothetical protein